MTPPELVHRVMILRSDLPELRRAIEIESRFVFGDPLPLTLRAAQLCELATGHMAYLTLTESDLILIANGLSRTVSATFRQLI